MNEIYRAQVDLLIRCLPEVAREECFALKGGTAINLFVRDMPRLSVDIDLTYVPLHPRDESLRAIEQALTRLGGNIEANIAGAAVEFLHNRDLSPAKLNVRLNGAMVKIEPNTVLRGTIHPPQDAELCDAAQAEFDRYVEVPILHSGDLYAGKLCAALDRQHPRTNDRRQRPNHRFARRWNPPRRERDTPIGKFSLRRRVRRR